jgi:hypothetical protein
MDIIYLAAAAALWVAALGLALGCERLQPHKVTP